MKIKIIMIFILVINFSGCVKKDDMNKDNNTVNPSLNEESITTDISLGVEHSVSSPMLVNDVVIETYNAYVDYIGDEGENLKDIYGNNPKNPIFYLAKIDDDDIPEMIILTDVGTADIYVLSCKNGKVASDVLSKRLYIDINCNDSVISSYNVNYVGYSYITYKLNEKGKLEEQCSHIETSSDVTNVDNNNLKDSYYIYSEEVTDEEYFKFMKNLLSDDKNIDYGMERISNGEYYTITKENMDKLRKGELY